MSDGPLDRLNSALEGRYRIERQVGEGGMATVYLADDLKHERKVALKVLKPELAAVVGADRFLAEIKVTANLQHPHILPLFDSGEADSFLYYVMPYVEGESLRERLERDLTLPVAEAVRIATDVAEALQAAHERGVIHRDIKPANILLSRGRALVADFGIARATQESENTRLTQIGSSLGTTGYMSPEQAMGSAEVDHRADIYSLGCMTFEMLAGEPPYAGPTTLATFTRQMTDPVPSVRSLRPTVPPGLDRAITVALAKEPAQRFEDASAFAKALVSRETGPTLVETTQEKTVVVLPFVNRSGDPENDYFSDGLTEEVISDLSGLSGLRVISRNSAMALKGTTKDTATLARELGVSHLVTGSVRRAGEALRVMAELVEARTDTPVWSEKYSGTMEDVFGIQEEISGHIVGALEVKLSDTEERQVAERPIEDVVAYDSYLRARQVMYGWTPEASDSALSFVNEAMAIVGESPLLLATAGQIHWNRVNTNCVPAEEGLAQAAELADRALAKDPESHLAIFVRGLVAGTRGQSQTALEDLHRANQLKPGDANVLAELCRYSNTSGLRNHWRFVERLNQLDPLTPVTPLVVSTYRWLNGPREEVAPPARRAMELAPTPSMLHVVAAWQIAAAGFEGEAVGILRAAGDGMSNPVEATHAHFLRCALEGKEEEALGYLNPETEGSVNNEISCRYMADGFALLGRRKDALRWLRKAIDLGMIHYPSLSEGDRFLEGLRGDPEFQELMAEVKPRWEAVVEWEARRS